MARIRVSRIGEQIKKELGSILQREMKDPRLGFVTVTGVEVTNDLSLARIYISIMGSEEQKQESIKVLEKAQGYLRSEIGKRIAMRKVPELVFKLDESIEYSQRINTLIAQLNQERKESDDESQP